MADKKEKCRCGAEHETCPAIADMVTNQYWCEACERVSPEKRCPACGLKARRIRGEVPGDKK